MPVILAIDTSTQACSCAVNVDGEVTEQFEVMPRQHAQKLLPMIDHLMATLKLGYHDLDAVAFGQGPGSFTGLRIAAGAAQGIAFGADLPVIGVSTLASQAQQVSDSIDSGLVFSALDARIDEVYWGFYQVEQGGVSLLGEEALCKPEALPLEFLAKRPPVTAVGSGLVYLERMPADYRSCFTRIEADVCPRAGVMSCLAMPLLAAGQCQAPEDISPVYLRDKVTHS